MIDKISFRINSPEGAFGPTLYPNVQVQLSTTDKEPLDDPGMNPLTNTFADNIGDDVKTVFEGNLVLSALNCVDRPCPFDVMIPLQENFMYDPANGNLLFDIRIPECPELGQFVPSFDLATNFPTKVSIAWDNEVDSGTAFTVSGTGLVTQFRFFVPRNVPTLSEWGLIAMAGVLGIIGLMAIRRRKVTS